MIVNRRIFTVKPRCMETIIDLLKSGADHMVEIPTFRGYQAMHGEGNCAMLELDFDDMAHYERFWATWGAAPEAAKVLERFRQHLETNQTNEIWQLR